MSRLPIRARMTAVFVAVMGGVLIAVGLFLYYRTEANLDDAINAALRARQGSLRIAAADARPGAPDAIAPGENFAQLLTPAGGVLATRPRRDALLTPAESARAARRLIVVERHERLRFVAGPARLHGQPVVAVAATSLADRESALEGLAKALVIGGPLALLLAAAIGYATAAGALLPVENIRRRADTIGRADPDARLPVSDANDEIHRLGLTLNRMLTRLADASAHERSFVANASHELRTPLTALQAQLDLALRHGKTVEELRTAITAAMADGRRLSALADDLLELAQADAPHPVRREHIDVDELLAAVAAQRRHAARTRGRELVARPSGLAVRADPVAIERAVGNMADNALVHGAGAIELGADLTSDGRSVELWVHDEGRLDEDLDRAAAFERFVRGNDANRKPGAGLGLALVQAVARGHGGSARLAPGSSDGVCATLSLPYALCAPAPDEGPD